MNFWTKIQTLPVSAKKLILWSVVISLSVVFLAFWLIGLKKRVVIFNEENLPEIAVSRFEFQEIETPAVELSPEIEEELLKQLTAPSSGSDLNQQADQENAQE